MGSNHALPPRLPILPLPVTSKPHAAARTCIGSRCRVNSVPYRTYPVLTAGKTATSRDNTTGSLLSVHEFSSAYKRFASQKWIHIPEVHLGQTSTQLTIPGAPHVFVTRLAATALATSRPARKCCLHHGKFEKENSETKGGAWISRVGRQ